MNVAGALVKDSEGKHFQELVDAEVSVLQGIGPFSTRVLDALGVSTVKELASYKFFLAARAIKTLSETEEKGGRLPGSIMNVDKAVDKEYETKSLKDLCEAPAEALEGIGAQASELLATLGVKTIGDLADFKYCRWAEAITQAAEFEEMLTTKERKIEKELKKLA